MLAGERRPGSRICKSGTLPFRPLPLPSTALLLLATILFAASLLLISFRVPQSEANLVGSFKVDNMLLVVDRTQTVLNITASTDDLLTIAVDLHRGDDVCTAFIHQLLPSWVRWRYVSFRDDDIAALKIDTPALVVTRWISTPSRIVDWAAQHPMPVGLMLMADETNVQDASVYSAFDYVLRHYYFAQLASHPHLPVRAMGNMTCGSSTTVPFPPAPPVNGEPRLGIHWIMLQARGLGQLDSAHRLGSYWLASRRSVPAVWIGSLRADREEMVKVMRAEFPDADIQVESGFGGSVGPYHYFYERTPRAVFGLIPHGNNAETHRLAETIDQGCIPVFLDAEFHQALFSSVPGVRAKSWSEASRIMKELLAGDPVVLDELQAHAVSWWHKWKDCITGDLDILLRATQSLK